MRRIAKIAALIPAAALTATLLAGCGPQTESFPYCQDNADFCLVGMNVVSAPGGIMKGLITLETLHKPRLLEIYAAIYWKSGGKWYAQDSKQYNLSNIPPVGKTAVLTPIMEGYCAKGYWVLQMHVIGQSSAGQNRSEFFIWPGAKNQGNTFQASENDIPQSSWPGMNFNNCQSAPAKGG